MGHLYKEFSLITGNHPEPPQRFFSTGTQTTSEARITPLVQPEEPRSRQRMDVEASQ